MSKFVSPITQLIAFNGLAAQMVADVARPLPAPLIPVALAHGVTEVGAGSTENSAAAPGPTVDEVVAAIRALMESGDSKAFGKSGEPGLVPLRKQVGAPVTDALRDEAWAIVKAEG
jgi:hypothetical protein